MTLEERKKLRRKALWTVADFARYLGLEDPRRARRALLRYNEAFDGKLLRPSRGANREYTFFWAQLAKHDAAIFLDDPIDAQARFDTVEDLVADLERAFRVVAAQTGQNTRDLARMKSRGARAA